MIAKILLSGQHQPTPPSHHRHPHYRHRHYHNCHQIIIATCLVSTPPWHHCTCKSNHQTSAVQIERLSFSSKSSKPRDALSPHQLVQSADGAEGKQDNQAECKQIQPNLPRSEVIGVCFRALLV